MLHDLNWLEPGEPFPPPSERERIDRYDTNLKIFNDEMGSLYEEYQPYLDRISKVVSNFSTYISFPVILSYQKLLTLKIADLVCGEYPVITGDSEEENDHLTEIREDTCFDEKMYATVIDISRYGDAIWRAYHSDDGVNFVAWDPRLWFPIVSSDGTLNIKQHVLCWRVNDGTEEKPEWRLHVQIHGKGFYQKRVYEMEEHGGTIGLEIENMRQIVRTGLNANAVTALRQFATSDTVYGHDDYKSIDAILAELMVRVSQISSILDKHADPSMTGPTSMLKKDPKTGEAYLQTGKFYGISPGEDQPKYLTWEGQLEAAFKQVELLLKQLYIISEVGSALLGDAGKEGGSAISGTAMRFKMVVPLAKARRIVNSLSLPARKLLSMLTDIEKKRISIEWSDGLPDDPRENLEMARLASGRENIMPLEKVIVEYFKRSDREAQEWISAIIAEGKKLEPSDDKGVNPKRKGSETGVQSFHGTNNS